MSDHPGAVWGVPANARDAWYALTAALTEQSAPAPCEAAPDLWFTTALVDEARAGCTCCLVVVQCLAYAVAADERDGVGGGLDERERRERVRHAS